MGFIKYFGYHIGSLIILFVGVCLILGGFSAGDHWIGQVTICFGIFLGATGVWCFREGKKH